MALYIPNPTYAAWTGMRQRCLNPRNPKYRYYGGRGISICEDWNTFANFLRDMGEKPLGTILDRLDNDGHYCRENCEWVSMRESNANRRKYGSCS